MYSAVLGCASKCATAGPILDPTTGQAMDGTVNNIGRIRRSAYPSFLCPIVFDRDGSIAGGGGVLGFFGFLHFSGSAYDLRVGLVVLNGAAVSNLGQVPFLGVFTHEI